jgi:pimeloyl-ACP methyl ester carboxylesterase
MPSRLPEPVPFEAGKAPTVRGEVAGSGAPIILCHGITATRRTVVHGSRVLERAGYAVVSYDARGHGESEPAPAGEGYGYPDLSADLGSVVAEAAGEGRCVLAGHSMGAHTALAFALANPGRVAGLVVVGPAYDGSMDEPSLRYWDGLAMALEGGGVEGFVDYVCRHQAIAPAWRSSVQRFTRERMLRHRHLEAIVDALRQVPRSRPFASLDDLEDLDLPVLVVASHDAADPGHPYAIAAAYAERLPGGRLISEEEGESPLAWQGGRLSRTIAEFCAEPGVAEQLTSG